jgi:hypothetical protein
MVIAFCINNRTLSLYMATFCAKLSTAYKPVSKSKHYHSDTTAQELLLDEMANLTENACQQRCCEYLT